MSQSQDFDFIGRSMTVGGSCNGHDYCRLEINGDLRQRLNTNDTLAIDVNEKELDG